MDLQYEYGNIYTSAHKNCCPVAVVVSSDFLSDKIKYPIAGQPLMYVQQYAHMSTMMNIARDMIFQRSGNYVRTRSWQVRRQDVFYADNIRLKLFPLCQKYRYNEFLSIFKEFMIPALINMTPPPHSRFHANYIKKFTYLKYLCNYDCTRSNPNN